MHARYRSVFHALVFVGILFAIPVALAGTIEATNYAVGTNLTNAFPGVTLEYVALGQDATEVNTSPLMVGTANAAGDEFMGVQPLFLNTLGSYTTGLSNFGDGVWTAISAVFADQATAVTVTGFNSSTDTQLLWAFGANGNVIDGQPVGSTTYSCLPLVPIGSTTPSCSLNNDIMETTTFTSTTPISSILVGSDSAAGYITDIDIAFTTVPEPASLAIFGGGLLTIVFAILGHRRRPVGSSAG